MITEYIELIESFKKNQISKLIETINLKIHEALSSPKFNPRIAPFLRNINKEGIPFTDFSLDPDNISQIKKIINALYHARLAFLDLENVDIRNLNRSASDLKLLFSKTIHESYQASYLLTHLDVDIKDMFSEEFALVLPLINKFQTFAANHSAQTKKLAEQFKTFPLSYKVGEITGIALEQMRPHSGDLDYNFLTQFSADLPGYIDKITQYISQYSSQIIEKEQGLNKEKIIELQNAGLKLLNDLEHLKGNSLFLPLKVLKYIHIIRNILTLSMSSLEQMGNLSDSSQDVIRDNLAQLKYFVLPTLFGLVDKIEDNAMLKPGTLSLSLMEKVKPLYELLIHYASKPVNFQAKGEELLSIEDSRFLALRLERTYNRIDTANKSLFKIKKAEEALNNFYELLDDPQFKDVAIHQLPQKIKDQLSTQYKIIKPYMMHLDVDFNEMLISSLQGPESWSSFLTTPWRWAKNKLPADHISYVLAQKNALRNLISKKRATEQFHIDLNMDLINSVQKEASLVLFPYSEKINFFTIDESTALNSANGATSSLKFKQEKEHNLLTNPEQLTADQALDLYQWYRNKHNKFIVARNAYDEFIALLKKYPETNGDVLHLNNLNDDIKAQCRNLYNLFQPYFVSYLPQEFTSFDAYIVHSLSNKATLSSPPTPNLFARMEEHFQTYFTQIDLSWNKKSRAYLRWAQEKFQSENDANKLVHDINPANRANHLIPHTNYSKFISEFRKELFKVKSVLNKAMNAELRTQSRGIPFPELENKNPIVAHNQTMAQSQQVLAMKQIFNSLYHVEGIVLELEKLTNRQYESLYVYHLFLAYGHINEILKLTRGLATDPHFGFIGRELLEKAQTIFATIREHSEAYQVSPSDVTPPKETVKYNALWYTLNAFFIIPKHVRALNNTNYLTTKELDELHVSAKNSAIRIEHIIKSSNSYFKLFLQSPNMYRLYRELTNKLNEFISTAHDTVIDNLDKFKSEIITPMLLEADLWEDKLGLKPGTLSDTLKTITDEYYKGLLHPLGLKSDIHIPLVCDKTPIKTRIDITNKKIESATKKQVELEKNYGYVEKLYQLIQVHNDLTDSIFPASMFSLENNRRTLIQQSKNTLIQAYPKAMPKLVKLQKKLGNHLGTNPDNLKFDALFNGVIKKYEPKLTQINALITAGHHFYLGKKATYQMQLETAKEKLTYLTELSQAQEKADLLYVEEYTTVSFNKQLEALCNRHIGLQYTDKEYSRKLNEYLLTFKNQIINESKTSSDIYLKVRVLLKEKISIFEAKNFAEYYHLDTVRVALAQFKNYFNLSNSAIENNSSVFESEKTLEKKSEYINQFIEISGNESLSIEKRLEEIKIKTKNPNFERVILAYRQEDYFSFTYLKQCIVSLLEALHLYTPTRKALYKSLNEAVSTQPKISELTYRFGLFAAPSTPAVGTSAVSNTTDEDQPTEVTKITPHDNPNAKGREEMLLFMRQMREPTHPDESILAVPTR